MSKHSFVYSVIEEFVKIDEESLKQINKIKLTKDKHVSDMNLNSYYNENLSLNNFIKNKLSNIFKKYNLTLKDSWVQKYLKNN